MASKTYLDVRVVSLMNVEGNNWDTEIIEDLFQEPDKNQTTPTNMHNDKLIWCGEELKKGCTLLGAARGPSGNSDAHSNLMSVCWKHINVMPIGSTAESLTEWITINMKTMSASTFYLLLVGYLLEDMGVNSRNQKVWNRFSPSTATVVSGARNYLEAWTCVQNSMSNNKDMKITGSQGTQVAWNFSVEAGKQKPSVSGKL
nr:hypothetical protein Iba_scaffold29650CG0050 [Ipomoea batatas]